MSDLLTDDLPPEGPHHRVPALAPDELERYRVLPKATWAECYRDLYAEMHGHAAGAWLADAEHRAAVLARYRRAT